MLQEKVQATLGVTPTYRVMHEQGEEHQKTFTVAVLLGKQPAGVGTGASKREAAQNAAREALLKLRD
jgi:ribonuclease-3